MFIHLANKKGDVLYSNVPTECSACITASRKSIEMAECPATGSKRRRARRKTDQGTVYFCGDEELLLKSRRIIRERLELYSEMLQELNRLHASMTLQARADLKRLMHNLLSQNAHNIQEVYNVASQDAMSLSMSEQIETVAKRIKADPTKAARALLRINKNNLAIKCEFAAFRFLHTSSKAALKTRNHNIRKVVMNALHPFFQDFKERKISIEADLYDGNVKIDYETIQVALYHVFENAAKYCLSKSPFKISYPIIEGRQVVCFDMISLQITDKDMDHLFEEGYSGEQPKNLGLAGAGLGMALINKLLALNNAVLTVDRNVDPAKKKSVLLGVYENNRFNMVLGKPN
jgi:K+-sensing histidine kinase KdpD